MIIDHLSQTIQLKICYFGPALSGKTTTMKSLFKHFGKEDRVKFVGPDCGLKGWNPPQVAYELLRRTYKVIKDVKNTK